MIEVTCDLSIEQNMKPYTFLNIYCRATGQEIKGLEKHKFLYYLTRSKVILGHLRCLGWTDNDISFFTSRLIETLKLNFYPTEFSYVSTLLLAINESPRLNLPTTEIPLTIELQQWIQQEVNRIKQEHVPNP